MGLYLEPGAGGGGGREGMMMTAGEMVLVVVSSSGIRLSHPNIQQRDTKLDFQQDGKKTADCQHRVSN